ncbi:MAG: pilus assembly protein TadG-related protein [Ilumatobacteraceae bacterium]
MFHSTRSDRDRGVILVWFSAFALVILGSGALVVDMGALWSERRQLQNGADAAALAVAIDCAKTACVQSQTTALNYARLNATDGEVSVTLCGWGADLTPCAQVPAGVSATVGYVQALTSTWNPGNGGSSDQVRFVLAPFLNALQVGQTVRASATVVWGTPNTATVLPLVISKCSFDPLWIAADGSLSIPNTQIEIKANSGELCSAGWTSGFDFLEDSSSNCQTTSIQLVLGGAILAAGAEGILPQCRPILEALYNSGQTFVVPIVKARTPPGATSIYISDGFASFKLCGYALGGSYIANSCSTICTGSPSDFRICGTFKPLTLNSGELGNGADYGTRILRMVG